eukprot:6113533-Alexandrium_andersonii.AAC.1
MARTGSRPRTSDAGRPRFQPDAPAAQASPTGVEPTLPSTPAGARLEPPPPARPGRAGCEEPRP